MWRSILLCCPWGIASWLFLLHYLFFGVIWTLHFFFGTPLACVSLN